MTLDIRTGSLLPGIAVAGLPAAPLPHRLLAPGTLLLAGVAPGTRIDLGGVCVGFTAGNPLRSGQ